MLPVLVQRVIYKHINSGLLEKKQRFIEQLDKKEINDFMVRNDSAETYASFSTLHSEFLQLSRTGLNSAQTKTVFIDEPRIIEGEQNDYRILQYHFKYEGNAYLLEIGNSLAEINDLTFTIRLFVLVVLVLIVLVTFLLDTFYIEYLLTPFYKIIDRKIKHVDEPDSFDPTPITTHSSDFEQLDTGLNHMMERISELFKKEKQFIANVSHELLTPIALLKNKFENLMQNQSLDEAAVDKVASSLRNLDMLKKIIGNLLLISRIDNHQYQRDEAVDFGSMLRELAEDLEGRIEDKGLTLSIEIGQAFDFTGNRTLLHILFYNLLVNAIKYNKPNGSIAVNDDFLDGQYVLSFCDSGIGMDAGQLEKIFDRFTRLSFDQEGQGLGLAIAQSIAHFHQIRLEVTSSIGFGTTFTLYFPKAN